MHFKYFTGVAFNCRLQFQNVNFFERIWHRRNTFYSMGGGVTECFTCDNYGIYTAQCKLCNQIYVELPKNKLSIR